MFWMFRITSMFAIVVSSASVLAAEQDDAFFEKRVRPLLIQHCYECHDENTQESGLRVDSLQALLQGGERGPAIVPGKPDESLLIQAVRHGELLKMPPKRKLATSEVAALEQWIARGASWPGESPGSVATFSRSNSPPSTGSYSAAQRDHWSFQKLTSPAIPAVTSREWVESPVDAFVLETLAKHSFTPAPAADKGTLIRRAMLDLIGLPPSPEEIDAFVGDNRSDAWPRLIDRLLASPQYGERWGRHWLDVARYADSNGLDENLAYAHAYRYRDYVVSAWNADLPFDVFVREQLAGDLIAPTGDQQKDNDQLVATGLLSLGAKMLAEDDPVKMQMDIIDEQVDTIGRMFLGMTLGCARCHDHKFDPISTADYYGLAGVFASTKTMETHTVVAKWLERPLGSPEVLALREQQLVKIRNIEARLDEVVNQETSRLQKEAREHAGDYWLAALRMEQLESLRKQLKPLGDNPDSAKQPGVITLEADQYARGNVLQDTTSYGVGIGVLVNRGESPNFAEYDVTVPDSGLFQLEVRYAAASERPTKLLLNGQLVKPDIAREVTGGWHPEHQRWKVEGFFHLKAGLNVIRFEQPQAFPHIDKLLVAPAPAEIQKISRLRLDAQYEPLPVLVSQWSKYLVKARQDASLSLEAWNFAAGVSDPDLLDLAEKFQNAARRVSDVWSKALATDNSIAALPDAEDEAIRQILFDSNGPFASTELESHFSPSEIARIQQMRQDKSQVESAMPKVPEAMAVKDDVPRDLKVHIRGSHLSLGALAPRSFPSILAGDTPPIDASKSGRLELAQWIANPENPLTARVLVNRIWQWHFGAGLVRSSDNFGVLGDRPTHPELLDWLSQDFVRSGWSIKALHRRIMLSSTYRMSTQFSPQAAEVDPDNTLLWRFNRQRLDAETLRDSILAVSDQLDLQMKGSLLPTENRKYVTSTANVDPVVYDSRRRSIYLPVVRSALFDVFQAFDFADPNVSQGKRETTTVAPQALFLMNSQFVAEQSQRCAHTLLSDSSRSDSERVQELFRKSIGRTASEAEVERALIFLSQYSCKQGEGSMELEESRRKAWQSLCRAVWSTNEFIYAE